MNNTQYQVRPGAYYDSVVLMQLQKSLAGLPGILDAGVVMATPANRDVLIASGFALTGIEAQADDLLIVVKAESETAAADAIAQVDALLKQRRAATTHDFRPRSLKGAADMLPDANWVLISVPGQYAAGVAGDALELGKHVFLYSDNVPLEDEVKLKQKAQEKGLLVMGPDCGTAVVNGVGLGFANRVRRGQIGIVAASGTGLQAVSAEIHNLGGGISQAVGTGGRDLKEAVGGVTAQQALDLLGRDPQTNVIVLVSKPPSAKVAAQLLRAAQTADKPVVVNFIGYPPPGRQLGNLFFVSGLTDAAETAVSLHNSQILATPGRPQNSKLPIAGHLRGLFSGGTLAYEMLLGLQSILIPIYSNIPIRPEQQLPDLMRSQDHTILDLGEDEFTQGRLHPMMDNDLRLRRLRQETADPDVDLLILDVVLGEGAHPDPAGAMAPAIAEAKKAGKRIVAIVVGTEDDPQDLNGQIERLAAAGATVFPNVNEALDYVYNRVPPVENPYPPVSLDAGDLAAINVGLESFYDSIKAQGGTAVHVDWRPPAGGNEKLMAILAKMKK
ncbi:MAG: acyl-CoA synthetase FdrA [Chloroflexi bacterium]|nr:acyl-CoA synthetase FdrA [Chloroflexota bacterium]